MESGGTEQRRPKRESPWTPEVVKLLREWSARAGASADAHYELCTRLSRSNLRFGVPVVVLTTFVGTTVFATLSHHVNVALRIAVGMISVLAAVLASLQSFYVLENAPRNTGPLPKPGRPCAATWKQ